MPRKFATIVIGLGAAGSAALYQLARRKNQALGLDRFSPPHPNGSSHGESRIIRKAIGEGEEYVPFSLRSYVLWREIEKETGRGILTITGGVTLEKQSHSAVMHGRPDFLEQAIRCAKAFAIRHEVLETADLKKRFPQFAVTDERAYYEYETGFARPELCIETQLHLARQQGAITRTGEDVLALESHSAEVRVVTSRQVYAAERVILTMGPWISRFLPPRHARFFKVYRQVMYWFEIEERYRRRFTPPAFPIFIWILGTGSEFGFYGFPSLDGETIKVATEQFAESCDPDRTERIVREDEIRSMYERYLRGRLPGISDRCRSAASCLYTRTPDSNFVIDTHPDDQRILVVSPCSGHGFKHSAAIGEALAEEVIDGRSKLDIGRFRFDRLAQRGA